MMDILIRSAVSSDAPACGRIIFQAFRRINERHGFISAYTEEALAVRVAALQLDHPEVYGVVAEADGRVVGSGFLDERALVRGIGPVTVDPEFQGRGVGRRLMERLLDRARTSPGARLVCDAFNGQALSLYASLGFEVKEPLAVVAGRPKSAGAAGAAVRAMSEDDLEACAELCVRVHGFDRSSELSDALPNLSPLVALDGSRINGYAATLTLWQAGHAVAENDEAVQALILRAAAAFATPVSFLLPTRQANLLRWCLRQGLRLEKPMLLMSVGEYQEPRGSWLPSARL